MVASSNWTSAGRAGRVPTGDDHVLGGVLARRALVAHADGVLVDERPFAEEQPDVVAAQLLAHDGGFGTDDARRHVHEMLHSRALVLLRVHRVRHVERAAGQLVQDGLAQRLRWDRAGVDRVPADAQPPLDDGDALAELGCLDRGTLTAGARADDDEIEVHRDPPSLPSAGGPCHPRTERAARTGATT